MTALSLASPAIGTWSSSGVQNVVQWRKTALLQIPRLRLSLSWPHNAASERDQACALSLPPIDWLAKYQGSLATVDFVVGITLAVHAVPVAPAYATLAGLPSQVGWGRDERIQLY